MHQMNGINTVQLALFVVIKHVGVGVAVRKARQGVANRLAVGGADLYKPADQLTKSG